MDDLMKDAEHRRPAVEIMARLNALFPTPASACNSDDFDLSPCSPNLRSVVRFSVYEFIVNGDCPTKQQRQAIQMKLLSWCDIPGYAQA